MLSVTPALAHAFGQRYDLPVPLALFVLGGAAVVFLSFLLVLPRPVKPATAGDGASPDDIKPLPAATPLRWSIAGLVLVGLVIIGWAGSTEVAENALPTFFWLLVWVAVPISCGILGDWTGSLNPFAALARISDSPRARQLVLAAPEPLQWPSWLGWWPAAGLFFIVACGELVFNATATLPRISAGGLAVYAAISAAAGFVFGAPSWLARGELFSVVFSTWGRLGWFRFGAPGRRGWGGGLVAQPFAPSVSRITLILLLLVSVSFDGLLSTDAWKSFRLHLPLGIAPGSPAYLASSLVAFLVLLLVAWALFGSFAAAVRRVGHLEGSASDVLAGLLPSLLPIAFGYLLAHNAEYLAINGQLLIPLLGNPAGVNGVQLLPAPFNDRYEINVDVLPSGIVWYFQVALIIGVHIAAVILAHRFLGRAARDTVMARRSEWPWIVAMVGYTMTSLWLLAQPLVAEGGTSTGWTTVSHALARVVS